MNKNLGRALAVVAALGVLYAGTSMWLGKRVEARYTTLLDRLESQLGADKVAERHYDRGVFGATSTVVLQFRVPDSVPEPGEAPSPSEGADAGAAPHADAASTAEAAASASGDAASAAVGAAAAQKPAQTGGHAGSTVRITLRDDIRHGPLAGWRPGAARIRTQVVSVEGISDETRKLFAKASAPEFVTYVGFGGGYDGRMSLPAGEMADPQRPASRAQWQAAEYDYRVNADATHVSGALRWPQLDFHAEGPADQSADAAEEESADGAAPATQAPAPGQPTTAVQIALKGLSMRFDYREVAGQWLMAPGKADGQIDELTFAHRGEAQTALQPALAMKALRFDAETVDNGGLLDTVVRAAGAGSLAGAEFKELRYESRVTRIDAQALATAQRMLMAFMKADAGKPAPDNEAQMQAMVERFLTAKPTYSDRYSATANDGQKGEFGYSLVVGDLPATAAALPPDIPWAVRAMQRLQVKADLRLPKSFGPAVAGMLNSPGVTAAELTQMADEFVRRGWLKQDGEVWTGSAEYAQGALQVNGQPFSLAQLLMGGGEPQADAAEEDDSTVDGVAGPGPQSSAAR